MTQTQSSLLSTRPHAQLDVDQLRGQFPALAQQVNGHPLVYLDNAATTQKPSCVIDAMTDYYSTDNANVHRGVHTLSERATAKYEAARESVRHYINAGSTREVIFTRGTTESINLVAQSFMRPRLGKGDEILISGLEHHSNIVPWQMVCEQTGATLRVAPLDEHGDVRLDAFASLLSSRTKLVAVAHVSNALGTVNPIPEMVAAAKAAGVAVLLDGAQAVPHMPVDVREIGCDFYAFSSHKMFGPTGVGVLYGKEQLLEDMPPYQGGGDMISMVTFEKTRYNDLPYKFEAGTPNIAGTIGLGRAVTFLQEVGLEKIQAYEHSLLNYASEQLTNVTGLRFIGEPRVRAGAISFVVDGVHPHDLGTIVNSLGVAIRTGHHCAMPVMQHFGVPATARASFALYNNTADIDKLVDALAGAREVFA